MLLQAVSLLDNTFHPEMFPDGHLPGQDISLTICFPDDAVPTQNIS